MSTPASSRQDAQPEVVQKMIRWLQKNGKFITQTPSARLLFHIHNNRISGEITLITKEENDQ